MGSVYHNFDLAKGHCVMPIHCLVMLIRVFMCSVFLRECIDSAFVLPCSQFRARDCHRCDVFLYCATQPIIESSAHMRFACLRMFYNELKGKLCST